MAGGRDGILEKNGESYMSSYELSIKTSNKRLQNILDKVMEDLRRNPEDTEIIKCSRISMVTNCK